MNSLTPLSLPRFHVNALSPTPREKLAVHEQPNESPFEAEMQEGAAPEADIDNPVAEADPEPVIAPMQPEIDTGAILANLEAMLAKLELASAAHAKDLVVNFVQSAFPRLADAFLAEEVVRELEQTLPPKIERLTLQVPTHLGAIFQSSLQSSEALREICEVKTLDDATDIVVDADWETGGLQFDFQRFLETSLAHLKGPESVQEGSHE